MGKIINYFENYDPTDSVALRKAYAYAAVLTFCTLILAVLHHLYFYHVQCAGMRLRVAMCHMIYRKVSVIRYEMCTSPAASEALGGSSTSPKHFVNRPI